MKAEIERLIAETRTMAIVAGQSSVEQRDPLMAQADARFAEYATAWADRLAALVVEGVTSQENPLREFAQHLPTCQMSGNCAKCGDDHRFGADHLFEHGFDADRDDPQCTCGLEDALVEGVTRQQQEQTGWGAVEKLQDGIKAATGHRMSCQRFTPPTIKMFPGDVVYDASKPCTCRGQDS